MLLVIVLDYGGEFYDGFEGPSGDIRYVAINYIFSLIWRCYGKKRDILDCGGKIIYDSISYYVLSKDKGL